MINSINSFRIDRCEIGVDDSLAGVSSLNGLTMVINTPTNLGSNFAGEKAVFHGARCDTSGTIETTSNYCMYGLNDGTTKRQTKTITLVLEYFTVDPALLTATVVRTITLNVPCGVLFKVRIPQSALKGAIPQHVRVSASSIPNFTTLSDCFMECSYQQL